MLDFNEEKLILSGFAISVLTAVAMLSARWPVIQPLFTTLCGTVTTLVTVYAGSNLTAKFIDNKYGPTSGDQPDQQAPK